MLQKRSGLDCWPKIICAASWVAGILVASREQLSELSDRNYVIDLGAELSHVEAELLLTIAKASSRHCFATNTDSGKPTIPKDASLQIGWLKMRKVVESITQALDASSTGSAGNVAPSPNFVLQASSVGVGRNQRSSCARSHLARASGIRKRKSQSSPQI
jgi:hypothetical protein